MHWSQPIRQKNYNIQKECNPMETLILAENEANTAAIAAKILIEGGLVALPTETVYGLGANGLDREAVAKIFQAKGRPQDNPLILHIAKPEQMEEICKDIPPCAWELAEKFWPGPLTMVLPCKDHVPSITTANLNTVAVRCPRTPITREIIALAGVPIAAPSANLSGKPSTTTAGHVFHDMAGKIQAIVDGGPCSVGLESTIVDLTGEKPRLLRPGGVTPEQLQAVLGELEIDGAVTGHMHEGEVVRAPGMKYKHYAPSAEVIIITGSRENAARYIQNHFTPRDAVLCFAEELPYYHQYNPTVYGQESDAGSLARGLFSALRDLDRSDIGTIYARCPQGGGVVFAIENRLKKAAGFHIVSGDDEQ